MVCIITFSYSFYIPFVLNGTLVCLTSLPRQVTQTFIPKVSGPLAVLLELSCGSFPLPLITAHRSTKRVLKDLLYPRHTFFLSPLCDGNPVSLKN